MAKTYYLSFGANPTVNTGLSPTFIGFKALGGSAATAPGITEIPGITGLYYFTYGPTTAVGFMIDGGASLTTSSRYIAGSLDPNDAMDEKLGTNADSFGSTSADPTTIFGFIKRYQEFNEGNSTFNKTTGVWNIFSRGSSTQLIQKTLGDTNSIVSKT